MNSGTKHLRRIALYVPGAYWAKSKLNLLQPSRAPSIRPSRRGRPPEVDEKRLRIEYERSRMSGLRDTFVLYRIIGNDLMPRHRRGQSRDNLAFILEHEPDFDACEKRFVVNRIVDPDEERAILSLLESHKKQYLHLPFDPVRYARTEWDIAGVPPRYAPFTRLYRRLGEEQQDRIRMRLYRYKNNAVMNNNGARNAALEDGRARAKWILPFDGNCFFNQSAWTVLRADIMRRPHYPYHIVPMARLLDNMQILDENAAPIADQEPQVVFRQDAQARFDPDYCYGRRPKIELLWRLGVPGPWDRWPVEPWDLVVPSYCGDAGRVAQSGWVARLFSGQRRLEDGGNSTALGDRGVARVAAVERLLSDLDDASSRSLRSTCVFVAGPKLEKENTTRHPLADRLLVSAEEALSRGPFSVLEKTTLAPSGDPHDYWHPAPYYWPHPLAKLGFPDMQRDGIRVPGTRLYEPLSEQFDRTRLQRTFDDTFVLALAYRQTAWPRFAEHAAACIRSWFIDPSTAMNPSLDYAQVRRGHNGNRGSASGIIEMKDLYFFLDTVRILREAGALSATDGERFDAWLGRYLGWLQDSPQGIVERSAPNNHGTYYDLQVASIAAYLCNDRLVRSTLRDSRSRILAQFASDGSQPEELRRTATAHYCCFNLQGWVNLAALANAAGEDLWNFEGPDGQSIVRGIEWLLSHLDRPWPYEQIEVFDSERFLPIHFAYLDRCGSRACDAKVLDRTAVKPIFDPHDGIRPFWQLR